MRMKSGVAAVMVAVGVAGPAWAAERAPTLTLGVQPSYFTGNYGTSTTTKITYVPVYAKYKTGNLSLKLTVPYISVESSGALVSGGTVIGTRNGGTVTRKSGMGDIWAEGRYRFRGAGSAPDVSPYAKIKFGTASHADGLGTGENDYEGGLGFEWTVGQTVFPFLDVGYRFVGSPPGKNLKNIATYDAGVTYKANEKNFLSGIYSGHQATQSGFASTADLLVAWNHDTRPGSGFQFYVDKGLSNGSPKYGVGAGAYVRF
ncbi:MAG: hypothetical protein HY274_07865 [Gammaproteobacteria bacterium]|nr:hypothetical protein [Gammaproteobacteria bacterium]